MNFQKTMIFLAVCLGVVTVTQPVGAIRAANNALPKEVNKSIKNRILELEKQKRSPETVVRTNSMINIANRLKLKRKKQNQKIVMVDFCGTATKAVKNGKCYLCNLGDPQNDWRFNKLWKQSPDLLTKMTRTRLKANNQSKIDQLTTIAGTRT